MVEWLSAQAAVHWLEVAGTARVHNWQGTAVAQSATAAPAAPMGLTQDQGTHPIWSAGITGAGQTIGGGDSGMGRFLLQSPCLSTPPPSPPPFTLPTPYLRIAAVADPGTPLTCACGRHNAVVLMVQAIVSAWP